MDALCKLLTASVRMKFLYQISAKTLADTCVALLDAFMLKCNEIQNGFMEITNV